jgi:hypothetical protein
VAVQQQGDRRRGSDDGAGAGGPKSAFPCFKLLSSRWALRREKTQHRLGKGQRRRWVLRCVPVGADFSGEQCSVGPISRFGSGTDCRLEAAL